MATEDRYTIFPYQLKAPPVLILFLFIYIKLDPPWGVLNGYDHLE